MTPPVPEAAAWGWLAHLREGGSTPWADWSAAATAEPSRSRLPGAQQLELLRRVNLVDRPSPQLVDALLATDPPRRSRPGLPLLGVAGTQDVDDPNRHGPPPVDPGALEDNELTRLAAVSLAGRLAGRDLPDLAGRLRRLPRPWRIRYHLFGDPEVVRPLRRHLTDRGRPSGGYGGQIVVVGTDTGRMLVDLWTAHAFRHGALPWQAWLEVCTRRATLPESLDLPRLARREEQGPGRRRIHVVTDPTRTAGLLGVRRGPGLPSPLAASATDLGRRVAAALRPLAPAPRRRRLLTEVLRPRLADAPGLPLVVPAAHREWVAEEAGRMHRQLLRGRYPVHGDPALVLPVERAGVETPEVADTLALAIRLLLETTPEEAS